MGGAQQAVSEAKYRDRRAGVWQQRYWEHCIRDERDLERHLDYVHFNPVKHGLSECPHGWAYSSFQRWVVRGGYEAGWQCGCEGRRPTRPVFEELRVGDME